MKLNRTVGGVFLNDFSFEIGDSQTHGRPLNPDSQRGRVKANGSGVLFCGNRSCSPNETREALPRRRLPADDPVAPL